MTAHATAVGRPALKWSLDKTRGAAVFVATKFNHDDAFVYLDGQDLVRQPVTISILF
jgi:hypothetical protein